MTRNKRVGGVIALAVVLWMSLDMWSRTADELLWGWRPFVLLVFGWALILLLIDWKSGSEESRRWTMLSSISGLLLSAGFPPSPLIPLLFIGFVPLLLVEYEVSQKRGGPARWTIFKYAFNAFLIWNICTTWWVLNTSFVPGIVANVLNSVFMAMVFVAFHQLRHLLGQRMHWLILASLWISFEYLHISWELSWPWLTLGNSFAQFPAWVQWYEYTGVFGGSLWVLGTNFLFWRLYRERQGQGIWNVRGLAAAGLLILLPIAFGIVRYVSYALPEGDTEIAIIQPNYEPHYSKFTVSQQEQLDQFLRLSDSILTDQTEYLVFPETSFGLIRLDNIESDFRIKALRKLVVDHPDLKLITGLASYRVHPEYVDMKSIRVDVRGNDTTYWDLQNSAIQISANEPLTPYYKSKLVPGPEIFPFKDFLPFLEPVIDMLGGTSAGHTIQPERDVFESSVSTAAPVICYESIYGNYVAGYVKKGAGIFYIITNDGWWDNSPGHIQHLKIGALRAIEHRRPIARSANSGVSCFINERGEVIQPTEYGVPTAISGKLKGKPTIVTFYTLWGDVIARICLGMAGLFIALGIVRGSMASTNKKSGT